MVNIFKDDMDPTLSKVGNVIEPKLKHYAESKLGNEFLTHDPFKIKFDAFRENKIFGGIPDGEPLLNGEIDYSSKLPMLEIKTSSIDGFTYTTEKGIMRMKKDGNGFPIIKQLNKKKEE
jgi:hypothetical protein